MPGTFSPPPASKEPLVSDPGMHHGTCVTHMPWCMSGSLTRGGGGKRSRHSRCMRNQQFCVPGKRTMALRCHVCCAHIGDVVSSTIAFSYLIGGWKRYYILMYRDPLNWFYCMLHVYNRCSLTNPRLSFTMDQIHNAHSAPVPYLTMYTFLFWMAHCGIWNRRIVVFFLD